MAGPRGRTAWLAGGWRLRVDLRGDEVRVARLARRVQVDVVAVEELRVLGALAVPVDEHRVGELRHVLLDDGVVAGLPRAGHLQVEEDHALPVGEEWLQ